MIWSILVTGCAVLLYVIPEYGLWGVNPVAWGILGWILAILSAIILEQLGVLPYIRKPEADARKVRE